MAFRPFTNPNTYAPSMKRSGATNPSALAGLIDRQDGESPISSSPFDGAAAMMGASPMPNVPAPQSAPQPESRQSVWQYPSANNSGFYAPVMSGLFDSQPAQQPQAQEPEEDDDTVYPFGTYTPTPVQIEGIDPLEYFFMQPVQARRSV